MWAGAWSAGLVVSSLHARTAAGMQRRREARSCAVNISLWLHYFIAAWLASAAQSRKWDGFAAAWLPGDATRSCALPAGLVLRAQSCAAPRRGFLTSASAMGGLNIDRIPCLQDNYGTCVFLGGGGGGGCGCAVWRGDGGGETRWRGWVRRAAVGTGARGRAQPYLLASFHVWGPGDCVPTLGDSLPGPARRAAWLLQEPSSGVVAVVDPSEAAPVIQALNAKCAECAECAGWVGHEWPGMVWHEWPGIAWTRLA